VAAGFRVQHPLGNRPDARFFKDRFFKGLWHRTFLSGDPGQAGFDPCLFFPDEPR
jgi:hypothetical protein